MVPSKQQDNEECTVAKLDELAKLRRYGVHESIYDCGQKCITTRWVVTKSNEGIVKARLVARGFQDKMM
jgi:hypothetical protein